MLGVVTKIIPFSSVDGPGNRTAIFLQGCNINCKYCHNPETRNSCINCGLCVQVCPQKALSLENGKVSFDASACISCDTCIKTCPHGSTPKTRLMTPEEVMEIVKKQMPFIRGITVSGGECMLQPDFITELFKLAKKENLGTLIDSNGTIDFREYPDLLEVSDGVMLDIKAFFPEDHRRVTDADNNKVLENAQFLGENNKLSEVRAVIVPDLYDVVKNIKAMGEFLVPLYKINPFRIKIIAFRPMGVREEYANLQVPTKQLLEELRGILADMGFEDIVII
ncbi:YjjW family glycine radical enzyme activase [Pseudobutyrivibrio sp.]|uniref:YjjW family glycine radical enzyme activase n=1 Tax=Pseudobutyrivibrio sp. TaxID=2014367 RepID=UPI0025D7C077|nr:YjjW family glycine radical enzyme activase [Pseudobutyrivibrio sp.]MBR5650205.1 YjjW family glycine radical enzyme activase [Pseudobutyrivibrio sp.]